MDKYYLQINFINRNDKKIITNYQLYNNDKLIKEFDDNNTKRISNIIKDYKRKYKLDIDKTDENYKIYDIDFLKKYIGIPAKKVSNINKYKKEIVFASSVVLSIIGLSIIDHKINPDLYNKTNIQSNNDIEDEPDFIFISNNPIETKETNEIDIKDVDTSVVYYPEEEKEENFKLEIYGDKDDNVQENILPTEMVSVSDNVYTRCIECEDLSNDDLLLSIKKIYKIPILLCNQKYGIDSNWIAAKIRRENGNSDVRSTTTGAGVGLLQLEGSVWSTTGLEDIDGTYVDFDLVKINNIAINHYNMDKVANFIETKNITTFDDLYNLDITDEEQMQYEITKDDLEKYKNAAYGIEKGCQVWEYNNNIIITNNNNNLYNYKLTDEECIDLGNLAYNKGITCINNCLYSTYNIEDTTNMAQGYPGDPDYQKNIDCFLPEGYVMTNRTRDGKIIQTKISHHELENIKTY